MLRILVYLNANAIRGYGDQKKTSTCLQCVAEEAETFKSEDKNQQVCVEYNYGKFFDFMMATNCIMFCKQMDTLRLPL